jgi:hypothetical protein
MTHVIRQLQQEGGSELLLTSLGAHISSDDARGEELCARAFSALRATTFG